MQHALPLPLPPHQVNAAASAQDIRIYLQLPSLCLSWDNIKETVSTALTASFLGYPFVVPGHINDCDPIRDVSSFSSSSSSSSSSYPPPSFADSHRNLTKMLYTRWMQISAFFPVMQFSIPPWHYNDRKTIAISKCMIEQHKHYVVPVAMRFLDDWRAATAVGSKGAAWLDSPLTFSLMKPLWHVADHDDQTALTIDDEFLVGE